MDRPGELPHTDLPEWLYMAIGGAGTHYEGSLGKGFSPDYTQPVLMEAHRRLLHALGERYDDDPRIAFIELGSLGHWGEWHVMQEEAVHIPFPGQKVTDVYVRHYLEAFPGKMLLMRRPFAIAAKNDFGLYNDMFGDEEATLGQYLPWIEDGYVSDLNGESLPGMPAFWDKSPSGGELANGSGGSAWLRTELLERTIEQARLTHLSWLGPNVPDLSDPTVRRHAELLQMAMGYRFSVVSETHFAMERPTRMIVGSVMMENAGAAPFYFPWTAQLALMDVTGERVTTVRLIRDIRILKPGRNRVRYAMACPATMAPGTYRLAIAIVDPDTGEPGIQMPMAEKTRDGWYLLGAVNVLP